MVMVGYNIENLKNKKLYRSYDGDVLLQSAILLIWIGWGGLSS